MSAVWPTALLGRLSPFGRASADGRYLLVRLGPQAVSPLVLLSPVTAVLLGWLVADEIFTLVQILGIALVLLSVWLSQRIRATGASAKRGEAPGEPVALPFAALSALPRAMSLSGSRPARPGRELQRRALAAGEGLTCRSAEIVGLRDDFRIRERRRVGRPVFRRLEALARLQVKGASSARTRADTPRETAPASRARREINMRGGNPIRRLAANVISACSAPATSGVVCSSGPISTVDLKDGE
jgi:hypothetical protein